MRVNHIAIVAVACGFSALARADIPPPQWPIDEIAESRAMVQPATGLSLGTFKVIFETTTFQNIAEIAAAPVGRQGDAGGFVMWVCFTLTEERERVWLTSSELGGMKYIDGAIAEVLVGDVAPNSDCPELPARFRPVRLESGVWLGSDIQALTRKFGAPSKNDRATYFSYSGKDNAYDVLSILVVQLEAERVTSLYAGHSTTN